MRAVLALVAAVALLAVGPAAAAAPKGQAGYGYHLYGQYCAGCHGPNAAGRLNQPGGSTGFGPGRSQGQQMGIGPSLHGVGALAADFYLRMRYMPLLRVGLQPEPSERVFFDDQQIRALTAYIASFGGPKIPRPHPERGSLSEGFAEFTQHCAGCHQIVAQGGYVTGALPPPLSQATTATEIAEAVRIGPYVMPKFTEKAISDRELDSIVRYVEYTTHPASPGGASLDLLGPVPEGLVTWFIAMPLILILCMLIGKRYRST
jgi:ubiquinol-cytochrome c reductase cytochrome c subunit